jgi:phosphopantothenoylcysteine decarboxylase/phosphopantothenate--cysteine ligase
VLSGRGVVVIPPEEGRLAGGDVGAGRLAEPAEIVATVERVLSRGELLGRRVLVTAGGTREPIDAVRFVGNRSSGKQGGAVAAEAALRGADVVLVTTRPEHAPPGVRVVVVETAAEMAAAMDVEAAAADVVVMAAAVADFRPAAPAERKLERGDSLTLELEPTPDLLAEVARIARGLDSAGEPTRQPLRPVPYLVGFAAETGGLERAADKLRRKGVDLLVANDVSAPGSGFAVETNEVTLLAADGRRDALPLLSKRDVAQHILDRVARALDDRDAAAQTDATRHDLAEPIREPT